ncbi:MAG: carbonic anhydrase [Bacillota bacterium]|nr:carbonic anhydrase [Bacillota bacterium]
MIEELLEINKNFVENKEYEKFICGKLPAKKTAVLSCMDTRLTELLPAALGFKNGDVKIIKNVGGVVTYPFGTVMRSLVVAVYGLGVENILVVGHYDCGMQVLNCKDMLEKMKSRGIPEERIELLKSAGVDLETWLTGFTDVTQSVRENVEFIKNHPLMPKDVKVFGFVMDPVTGKVDPVK